MNILILYLQTFTFEWTYYFLDVKNKSPSFSRGITRVIVVQSWINRYSTLWYEGVKAAIRRRLWSWLRELAASSTGAWAKGECTDRKNLNKSKRSWSMRYLFAANGVIYSIQWYFLFEWPRCLWNLVTLNQLKFYLSELNVFAWWNVWITQ